MFQRRAVPATSPLRCLTIERVYQICQRRNQLLPRHLVVQADNTVAWAKNKLVLMALAVLASRRKFSTAVLNFLMVGHTHEDVDQLFGVVASLILQRFKFQTPQDLVRHLESTLRARVQAKGEELHVGQLRTVRDFAGWLAPVRRELYNALASREGIEAPHSFAMKRRQDLSQQEAAMMRGPGVPESERPADVMCVVKTYMRDRQPQQAPVCALPAGRAAGIPPSPDQHLATSPLSAKQIEDYLTLARELEENWDVPEAAAALRALVLERHYEWPASEWLQAPGLPEEPAVDTGNPFFPHLPASSWRLLVRDVPA